MQVTKKWVIRTVVALVAIAVVSQIYLYRQASYGTMPELEGDDWPILFDLANEPIRLVVKNAGPRNRGKRYNFMVNPRPAHLSEEWASCIPPKSDALSKQVPKDHQLLIGLPKHELAAVCFVVDDTNGFFVGTLWSNDK